MAGRTPKDTPVQEAATSPAATIRTQEYSAGVGWEIGQKAPEDAFRALDDAGSGGVTGPVVNRHPGGYARQIAVKGQIITAGARRELDAAKADQDAAESDEV